MVVIYTTPASNGLDHKSRMEYPVTDIYAFLISSMLPSCCGHYILHGFTALIIFGEE
jgi:hypothetical protein